MRTWTATTTADSRPEAVLEVLTDPDACRAWAPVAFDVRGLDNDRLRAGSQARVTGSVAGLRVGFDVDVHEAAASRLSLTATGPIGFEVAYDLEAVGDGAEVRASVRVLPGGGLQGRLIARAAEALLAGGALQATVGRIAREAALTTV